jgi:hypothetical protein
MASGVAIGCGCCCAADPVDIIAIAAPTSDAHVTNRMSWVLIVTSPFFRRNSNALYATIRATPLGKAEYTR